ncbi:transposase [Streptomyces hygroscopicus subsp. limoneus]|nr:transposase [Streptomyces hygroscopicus subsp. limoneus]
MTQLPKKYRRGRRTLIRTDSAGGTHDFVSWLARRGRLLSYLVGMVITETIHQHVLEIPHRPGLRPPRPAARSATEHGSPNSPVTSLRGWPKGMPLIVRKERPHHGSQLGITDADGMRVTCFAINTAERPIARP